MVKTQISTSKAEIKELEKRMKEVEANIDDYGSKSKSSERAIAEMVKLLEEDMKKAALFEAQQARRVALVFEKKLVTVTKAKDDEIRRCKNHLNDQRIKMTGEHRATYERQELYHSRIVREIEGRYQKALISAETQHITELQSKNERIRNLESKVTKLEAQLLVHQSSAQEGIQRSTIEDSKHSGTVQRGGVQDEQDQSDANRVTSLQESEYSESEGYQSEPEDDNTVLLLNPRIDSTTAAV